MNSVFNGTLRYVATFVLITVEIALPDNCQWKKNEKMDIIEQKY
jgi:hypothetical protein